MPRLTRATWISAGVVAGAVALALALRNSAQEGAVGAGEPAKARVRTVELRPRALSGLVRVGGFLRARQDITISAERAGRVVGLPVAEGGPVARGEIVARLDDTIASAELSRARAAAREAGLNPDMDAAEVERALSSLRRAEHELALHSPRSPIGGVVEVQRVDAGEYVTPGTPLVDVLDLTALVLDVDIDPDLVGRIAGATVTVAGRKVAVRRVANRADSRTRRFRIELELEPEGLRPGMFAEALFELPAGGSELYVPKAAVRVVRGERGLFLVRDGRAAWVAVRVGEVAYRPGLWRITGGDLRGAGETLVVAGFSGLRAGMAVESDA